MKQSIILQEEERSETLEGVQVLKINSIQEDLATQVEESSQVKSREEISLNRISDRDLTTIVAK